MANLAANPRSRSTDPFFGKRVLITGGSSGIGLALAQELVQRGAHLCIVARDPGRLDAAVGDLRKLANLPNQMVCAESIDVTVQDSVDQGIPRVLAALGGLDVLINNAGYAVCGYIDQLSDDVYREMMAINYFGPLRMVRALLPHFLKQGSGHIVNVTSMLGFMGTFGYSAYCASKYALSGFTECLRQDLRPFGIKVHLCYPPTTKTPGLERENLTKPRETWAIEGTSKALPPEAVARAILRGIARNRFYLVAGFESWLIWFVQRLAPWLVRRITDGVLLKDLRAHGDGRKQLAASR